MQALCLLYLGLRIRGRGILVCRPRGCYPLGIICSSLSGYNVFRPPKALSSLIGLEDPTEHGHRRRVWDRAFTPAAIKSYQPMLDNREGQLLAQFDAHVGQPIDIAQWFGFMTMDFMGDFA
jgi:cytochrome P450